jgi:cytochrome c oxidase subunit 3
MSTAEARPKAERLPVHGRGLVGTAWWGMLCLIATEALLFVYLIFSYAFLDSQSDGAAFVTGGAPSLKLALPATILLLLSSGTAEWSKRRARAGNLNQSRLGLAATLLLGLAFVGLSLKEWADKPFALSDTSYSSIYFLMTGTHLAHVVVGLLAIMAVLLWSLVGRVHAGHDQHRTLVTLYWHFVDVVWLFVFATIYLSPRIA